MCCARLAGADWRRAAPGLQKIATLAAIFLLAALSLVIFISEANAQVAACTRIITPKDSLETSANSLQPGDVLCLRAGEYTDPNDGLFDISAAGSANNRIEVRSYSGEVATLKDQLWLNRQAKNVTIRSLNLTSTYKSTLSVYGDDVWLLDNDISNPQDICVFVGEANNGVLGKAAARTVIQGNRVHDCGGQSNNHRHGIYVVNAAYTQILGNRIYDNVDRGIQLYPNAQGTIVGNNVIDGNGEGINLSGAGVYSTSNSIVANNIISNSRMRWNVESWWEIAYVVGTNNIIQNNCFYASNSNDYYNGIGNGGITTETPLGFTAKNNTVADPSFVDRSAKDFRLRDDSPCKTILESPVVMPSPPNTAPKHKKRHRQKHHRHKRHH